MKVIRARIDALTASFRYPRFVRGFQPTLLLPPLSTIYGILSACKGERVTPSDTRVGYVFFHYGKARDLERIHETGEKGKTKTNVIWREFLLRPKLFLYVEDLFLKDQLKEPSYPILLGRSSDLARVSDLKIIELEERKNVKLQNTIVPFWLEGVSGEVQALPTHFTEDVPRKAKGVQPFFLLMDEWECPRKCYYDQDKGWGVWMHITERS